MALTAQVVRPSNLCLGKSDCLRRESGGFKEHKIKLCSLNKISDVANNSDRQTVVAVDPLYTVKSRLREQQQESGKE